MTFCTLTSDFDIGFDHYIFEMILKFISNLITRWRASFQKLKDIQTTKVHENIYKYFKEMKVFSVEKKLQKNNVDNLFIVMKSIIMFFGFSTTRSFS